LARAPTDSKYGSDSYHHQGNTLAHLHDTLCVKKDKSDQDGIYLKEPNPIESDSDIKTNQQNCFNFDGPVHATSSR